MLFLQRTAITSCDLTMFDFAQAVVKVKDRKHLVRLSEKILQQVQ